MLASSLAGKAAVEMLTVDLPRGRHIGVDGDRAGRRPETLLPEHWFDDDLE